MEIDKLESVCAVNIYKNYTEAAYNRFISPTTISKHISRVEEELGIPLFERATKTKPVTLTLQGENIIEYIQTIVSTYHEMQQAIKSSEKQDILTIGYSPIIGTLGQTDIFTDFVAQNPDVVLSRRAAPGIELAGMLITQMVEGILLSTMGEDPFEDANLSPLKAPEYERILVKENKSLYIGFSERHPLASSVRLTPDLYPCLKGETFLFSPKSSAAGSLHSPQHIQKLLGIDERDMRCVFVDIINNDVALEMVRKGRAILPNAACINRNLQGIRFVPVEGWNTPTRLYFICHKSNQSKVFKRFKKVVEQHNEEKQ